MSYTVIPGSYPTAHGDPLFSASLKTHPDDFVVEEMLGFDLSGEGEHVFLEIEKRSLNTAELVKRLARVFKVKDRDVGFSGLKDRHACTTQWFSVCSSTIPDDIEDALRAYNQAGEKISLISQHRHSRKLKRGSHRANRFVITLRQVHSCSANEAEVLSKIVSDRLSLIARKGFPAYLGAQRFGKDGQNVERALAYFKNPKQRVSRHKRGLYLSSARSVIFNAVLAERVRLDNWDQLLPGEPVMLDGTSSHFSPDPAELPDLLPRLQALDIHPSGPWVGQGNSTSIGDAYSLENTVLNQHQDLCAGLSQQGLKQQRRALREVVYELSHEWKDKHTLTLSFTLRPGVFATTLLTELGRCNEPTQAHITVR